MNSLTDFQQRVLLLALSVFVLILSVAAGPEVTAWTARISLTVVALAQVHLLWGNVIYPSMLGWFKSLFNNSENGNVDQRDTGATSEHEQ